VVCDPAFLSEVPLFKLLDEQERIGLAAVLYLVPVAKGDVLFRFGDPADDGDHGRAAEAGGETSFQA
jgi:hypothetical protein